MFADEGIHHVGNSNPCSSHGQYLSSLVLFDFSVGPKKRYLVRSCQDMAMLVLKTINILNPMLLVKLHGQVRFAVAACLGSEPTAVSFLC